MAVVPYYDQTKVKADLRITDTSQDTQLDHWGEEAENEIDDLVYILAAKARLLTKLPVLPYASGSVPESIQGAADHYVMMRFYEFTRNAEMQAMQAKAWKEKVSNYVDRLKTDSLIYGRIAR
jgi:hypothetical protein